MKFGIRRPSIRKRIALFAIASLIVLTALGCQLTPSAVAVPSSTPQPPTASPTMAPTATLTQAPTLTPTTTPTPAPTAPPTATPTSAPITREDGFTLYTVAQDGYEIALPPGWQKIDLDPERMKDNLDKIGETDPAFAETFGEQTRNFLSTSGIQFYAADLSLESVKSGFLPNLNVIKSPVGLDVGVEVLTELSIQQLEQMANIIKPVNNKSLVLPAGKAQRLSYKMKLTLPDQTQITLATTQFIFLKDKTSYVITLAVKADRATKYAGAFDKIGESFLFIP